ncbi:MAG TPA: hypothetical protein PLZ13_14230, partial [Ottowia sp.]|nr:hypothetical protein [Ottowia sp.]
EPQRSHATRARKPYLKPHITGCRLYNCTHLHEPGCGVIAAVESSAESAAGPYPISASRYKIHSDLFRKLRPGAG